MSKLGENDQGMVFDQALITTLDLHNPQFEHRPFVLRRSGTAELKFENFKLQVLVPRSVYLVPEDADGLKGGQVLIRNLELTERLGHNKSKYEDQVFVRYDNLYDTWRAMSRLNPTYKKAEIPTLKELHADTDACMEMAWTLEPKIIGQRVAYELRAFQAVNPHRHARNKHKVAAVNQGLRAAKIKDRRGRDNTGRLPLMWLTVDILAWKRIREARSIGHRMDFRAMVLELYIYKLCEMVNQTRVDLKQMLRNAGPFKEGRTPGNLIKAGERLCASARHLGKLCVRPFSRVFEHVTTDIVAAADFMDDSANSRDPLKAEQAQQLVHRAYRSLVIVQHSRAIQEMLATVAAVYHRKEALPEDVIKSLLDTIVELMDVFNAHEPFTDEPLEQGFIKPVLDRVCSHLDIVAEHLVQIDDKNVDHLKKAYQQLKLAVAPL